MISPDPSYCSASPVSIFRTGARQQHFDALKSPVRNHGFSLRLLDSFLAFVLHQLFSSLSVRKNFTMGHAQSILAPLHLLSFSCLLGASLYQSFVMTKVCFKALPASAFAMLQRKVFPVHFALQLAFTVASAATCPFVRRRAWGADIALLSVAGAMAALNMFVYGPQTSTVMMERIHQGECTSWMDDSVVELTRLVYAELREGKKHNAHDASEEMRLVNRRFSRTHAMCIHLNMLGILATLAYGVRLGSMLSL